MNPVSDRPDGESHYRKDSVPVYNSLGERRGSTGFILKSWSGFFSLIKGFILYKGIYNSSKRAGTPLEKREFLPQLLKVE
jgi:hypothetical protein